jgi:hypothetical protein
MTRGMHLVRTISMAVVALALMTQAAQARPSGLPPGGAAQANAVSHQALVSPHSGQLGAAVAAASRDYASRPGRGEVGGPTVLHLAAVERPATTSSPSSVNWLAVLGGTAIIATIGGLILVMSRQRPHRPATA